MSRPTANLRLFVAAFPPREIVDDLHRELAVLVLPHHRIVPPEQVHLTLQFIGDTPSRELDSVIESVQRSAAGLGAFRLRTLRLISLPQRGPARLIAAETDAPALLLELQRRLAMRLASHVRALDDKPFRPHLTLCRFASPAHSVSIDHDLQSRQFTVDRLALMRSTLAPQGAQHHEVTTITLPA